MSAPTLASPTARGLFYSAHIPSGLIFLITARIMPQFDAIDEKLLEMLQENGRVSQHDLARSVGLSAPAVAERVRKLEDRGIVRGYRAVLDPRALGLDITAFIAVGIAGSKYYPEFRRRVGEVPEVQECHSVTGQGSHLLKVRVANTAGLERLLAEMQAWPGVQGTTTSLVLSTVKETAELPVPSGEEEGGSEDDPGAARSARDLLHVPFRHNP